MPLVGLQQSVSVLTKASLPMARHALYMIVLLTVA